MKFALKTALLLTLCLPTTVMAAPTIDEAGAKALKTHIERVLNTQTKLLAASGNTLKQTGALSVEPAGTYYAVTTPNLTLTDAEKNTQTIGMIAINAVPTNNPQAYKMAVALPTPMPIQDNTGAQIGSLSIGNQNMNGLYDFELQTFTELNATYTDVSLAYTDGTTLAIPTITTQSKLTNQGQGLLTGPQQTKISNLQYADISNTITVKNIDMRTQVEDFDAMATPLTNPVADLLNIANNLTVNLTLTDLAITSKAPDNQNPPIKIGSGTINLASKDMKSGKGSIITDITAQNITTGTNSSPARAAISLSASGIPAPTSETKNQNITTRLKSAGTNLKITKLSLESENYNITGNASGAFTPEATQGVTGTATMQFAANPVALMTNTDLISQGLAMLTILPIGGQATVDATGKQSKSFTFELAKDGAISVNNQPFIPAPQTAAK